MDSLLIPCFFEEAYSQYQTNLRRCAIKSKPKSIHDLRVAYKKLLALKSFAGFLSDQFTDNNDKWWLTHNELYRKGGKYRNYHVILKLFHQLGMNEAYPDIELMICGKIENKGKEFVQAIKMHRCPSSVNVRKWFAFYSNVNEEVVRKRLMDFINVNYKKSAVLLSEHPSDCWHEARHLLKSNFLLLKGLMSQSNQTIESEQLLLNSFFEQELGKWHDMLMLRDYLKISLPENNVIPLSKFVEPVIHLHEKMIRDNIDRIVLPS